MELKNFIKNTLISVIEGVDDAQKTLKENSECDAVINATRVNTIPTYADNTTVPKHRKIYEIDLDIAVTVENIKAQEKEAGVQIKVFGGSINSDKQQLNSTVSRVKFSIPIIYPS